MKTVTAAALAALVVGMCGCDSASTTDSPPAAADKTVPSLDEAVSNLNKDLQDVADAAKEKLNAISGDEFKRIFNELNDIAADFDKHAAQLKDDAQREFQKLRKDYEEKKKIFEQRLKEFDEKTGPAKDELMKGLYEALSDMKTALDRAAEAYRKGAPPAEQPAPKPSEQPV